MFQKEKEDFEKTKFASSCSVVFYTAALQGGLSITQEVTAISFRLLNYPKVSVPKTLSQPSTDSNLRYSDKNPNWTVYAVCQYLSPSNEHSISIRLKIGYFLSFF